MTPRLFAALVRRHSQVKDEEGRRQELMLAQLTAMVANTGFRRLWDTMRKPEEFLLTKAKPHTAPRRRRKSFDEELGRVMERAAAYQKAQPNGGS